MGKIISFTGGNRTLIIDALSAQCGGSFLLGGSCGPVPIPGFRDGERCTVQSECILGVLENIGATSALSGPDPQEFEIGACDRHVDHLFLHLPSVIGRGLLF